MRLPHEESAGARSTTTRAVVARAGVALRLARAKAREAFGQALGLTRDELIEVAHGAEQCEEERVDAFATQALAKNGADKTTMQTRAIQPAELASAALGPDDVVGCTQDNDAGDNARHRTQRGARVFGVKEFERDHHHRERLQPQLRPSGEPGEAMIAEKGAGGCGLHARSMQPLQRGRIGFAERVEYQRLKAEKSWIGGAPILALAQTLFDQIA